MFLRVYLIEMVGNFFTYIWIKEKCIFKQYYIIYNGCVQVIVHESLQLILGSVDECDNCQRKNLKYNCHPAG